MILAQWDADDKLASVLKLAPLLALVVTGRDGAVVQFHERTGQVETDSRTDVAVVRVIRTLVEALEDGFQLILRYTDAAVLDADVGMVVGMGEREENMTCRRGKLEGIRKDL